MLRKSLLVSSVCFNSETWYGLSEKDLSDLSSSDRIFFSKLFHLPKTTAFEGLFLEAGCLRLRDVIKRRRVMYLHSLATRGNDEMARKVINHQWNNPPIKNDWAGTVKEDLGDLKIDVDDIEEVKRIPKQNFKEIVSERIEEFVFTWLMELKDSHSKLSNLKYKDLKIRQYFVDKIISTEEKILVIKWRLWH